MAIGFLFWENNNSLHKTIPESTEKVMKFVVLHILKKKDFNANKGNLILKTKDLNARLKVRRRTQ